jgi:hypothetical protein
VVGGLDREAQGFLVRSTTCWKDLSDATLEWFRNEMNVPDPQRLGGLAWVRRTGGQLSRAERRHLLRAVAVGQWENAVGRAELALGRLPAAAARVDLSTFQAPDSKFAREAEDACAEMPPALQGHSYRTWLFGRALAIVDRSEMDDELFYCGALLHDYGIVSPTANRDFTLGSVDRMLRWREYDRGALSPWQARRARSSRLSPTHRAAPGKLAPCSR